MYSFLLHYFFYIFSFYCFIISLQFIYKRKTFCALVWDQRDRAESFKLGSKALSLFGSIFYSFNDLAEDEIASAR